MAEYIEREALLERIDGIWDCADMVFEPNDKCCRADDCASCKWRETKNAIRKIAAYLPAADVRPVVHGHWEETVEDDDYGEYVLFKCDRCGNLSPRRRNFCHYCGADMGGMT